MPKTNDHPRLQAELTFLDYWNSITRRKVLILGCFLAGLVLAFILIRVLPTIRPVVVMYSIARTDQIRPAEVVTYVANAYEINPNVVFPKAADVVDDLRLTYQDGTSNLNSVLAMINVKDVGHVDEIVQELADYIGDIKQLKEAVVRKQEKIRFSIKETQGLLDESTQVKATWNKLITEGQAGMFGFNPLDVQRTIKDLRESEFQLKSDLSWLHLVEVIGRPIVSIRPVSPNVPVILVSGALGGILVGLIWAFFLEGLQRAAQRE